MGQESQTHQMMIDGLVKLVGHVLMSEEVYHPGLDGVVAGETQISSIDGGLQYRGYEIEELAHEATFLEVAYLLIHQELPNLEQLADFRSIISDSTELAEPILKFFEQIPLHVSIMDVLRTGISSVAHFDMQGVDEPNETALTKATRLFAVIPMMIAARYRLTHGLKPIRPRPDLSYAADLLYQITGREPNSLEEKSLDVSLILYAEHEYNASTYASRIVTSTGSDLFSAITAAVGTIKGKLDGGAGERVMQILDAVGSPDNAATWISQRLSRKKRVMGFGHRVYKKGDPRAVILKDFCLQLAEQQGNLTLEQTAEAVEQAVFAETGLMPNLDWPSARLYHYLGLDVDLYTPLFVAARVAGWSAHVMEQSENNRLIRPRSRYVGEPKRNFRPLDER